MKYYTLKYPAWQILIAVLYTMQQKTKDKINVTILAKKVGRLAAQIYKYIDSLEHQGIITTSNESRSRYLDLTDQGKKMAKAFMVVISDKTIKEYSEGVYYGE